MQGLLLLLLIIFIVIIIACLWYSFGTGPQVTEQDILDATGNGNTPTNASAFMISKPENYKQTQPTRAVFTNWQNLKGVTNTGFYNFPKEGARMSTYGKVHFACDVQVGNNRMLPRLNLLSGDKVLNTVELPVKMSKNGNNYYIPAGKYSVEHVGQLSSGDNVMFEVSAPPSDITNVMKSALGHAETCFGGYKV